MNTEHEMMRLKQACLKNGPLCVGLDTDPSYIPPEVLRRYESPAAAVLAYNRALIEATAPYAGCYKVQIAYYEAAGLAGLGTYAETIKMLRSAGIPVISDIKRGDIADTAKAYARAHFSGDFETDCITVNPYMGFDTLEPFTAFCHPAGSEAALAAGRAGKSFFVLLRTSNRGMTDIEKQPLAAGGAVLDHVGAHLKKLSADFAAEYGMQPGNPDWCSPVGAVVGCTEKSDARALRDAYPDVFFLIPGYGAQGGGAEIAATLLDKAGGTVNSSRGILCAWKKAPELADKTAAGTLTLQDIVGAAEKAAADSKADLLAAFRTVVKPQ